MAHRFPKPAPPRRIRYGVGVFGMILTLLAFLAVPFALLYLAIRVVRAAWGA